MSAVARTFVYLCLILLTSCAGRPYVWASEVAADQTDGQAIQPGDHISVVVRGQPSLSGDYDVGPDGRYVQPMAGHIEIGGLTPQRAAREVAKQLEGIVVDPKVSIAVAQPASIRVSVIGEVEDPGLFEISPDEGVLAVLARAGGLTEFGDRDGIYVVRSQPQRLRIRFRYEDLTGADAASHAFRFHDGDVLVVE